VPVLDVNWNPSRRELRQFAGILLPAFAGIVGAIVVYRSGSWNTAFAIWGAAFVVGAAGLAVPAFARLVFVTWMAAAYPIGWTVSHLVLGATYYLVFTPIGLIMRWIGRDALARTGTLSEKTYWVAHEPSREPASYFRQF
jgi:hypothetical protein